MKNLKKKFIYFPVFCTILISLIFSLSNYIHVPIHDLEDLILNLAHLGIVSLATFVVCYVLSVSKWIFVVTFPLLILLSALVSFFIYVYNVTLTVPIIELTLQNDIRTSLDFVSVPFIFFIILSLIVIIVTVYLRFRVFSFKVKKFEISFVVIAATIIFLINEYKNNTVFQRIPFSIFYTYNQYSKQQNVLNQTRIEIGKDVISKNDSITVILVIGESCRADHLQLNGYPRKTNPHLSNLPVISFPNVFSEWTYTNTSLPHILTRSDSKNHRPLASEKSFISIFNRAGFFTSWIANQEPAVTFISMVQEAQEVIYTNPAKSVYLFNNKWLDTDNLQHLQNVLKNKNPKKLIIIHTIGSHWWYNDHFTEEFAKFQPILNSKIISNQNRIEIINSYDNTILFTDYFLSRIISMLTNEKACMIYLSDHGESLGENGKWLHAQGNFPEHYPAALIWLSNKYISNYKTIHENIVKNRDKDWHTDFLFPSILSLAGLDSKVISTTNNITIVINSNTKQ